MEDKIERLGLIYIARNKTKNMVYVGQTISGLEYRKKQHMTGKRNTYFDEELYWNKHDDWEWGILEDNVKRSDLDDREMFHIKEYNSYFNGYNSTHGGNFNCKVAKEITLINELGEFLVGTAEQLSQKLECSAQLISQIVRMKYRKAKGYKFYSISEK